MEEGGAGGAGGGGVFGVGAGRSCLGFAATTDTRATGALRGVTTAGAATNTLGAETLGAERCGFAACLAGGGGSGAA